jgi:hypothetical protein
VNTTIWFLFLFRREEALLVRTNKKSNDDDDDDNDAIPVVFIDRIESTMESSIVKYERMTI